MRIVFIRSNPVDPDSRVEKEVNSLLKIGHSIEVIGWDRSNKYKKKDEILELHNGSVAIHRFGIPAIFGGGFKKNLIPLIKFQLNIFSWLIKNRKKYDAIHACDFDTAFSSFICAKLLKKKLIYDIFDYYVDSFHVPKVLKRVVEKIDHLIINKSDAVIICSEKRKEQIKGSHPKKLYIIHNSPPDLSDKINIKHLNKEKVKIVYVGILSEGRFLKEIADIIKDKSEYEFHIGGFGKLENYFKDLSKKYDNIYFYGKLPYKETLELEKSCDIMTAIYDPYIPNHKYAAPNKFYEALMLGKPIIMIKNTGMDDIVSKYKIGEVIEYNKVSLLKAFEKLKRQREKWKDIAIIMKDIYNKNYSWPIMEIELYSLYKNL